MKVSFWGTSHGVPEKNRKCTTILIEVQKNRYFLDMGSSVIEKLINENMEFSSVKGIFITHMHGDHTFGLPAFIDLSDWFFKNYKTKILLPRESAKESLKQWILENRMGTNGWVHKLSADILSYDSGVIFNDGIIKVTAIKNQHIDDSYSFLVEHEEKRVVFTGDLKNPTIDFPLSVLDKDVDLLICEAAHFPISDYTEVLINEKIKKIYVTHYVEKMLNSLKEIEKDIGKDINIASDNDTIMIY